MSGISFMSDLINRLPSGDGRAVEHEPFFKEVFVHLIREHGHVLQLAARIGETDVDVFDILVLDRFQRSPCYSCRYALPSACVGCSISGMASEVSERVRRRLFPRSGCAMAFFDVRHENLAVANLVCLGRGRRSPRRPRRPDRRPEPPRSSPSARNRRHIPRRDRVPCGLSDDRSPSPRSRSGPELRYPEGPLSPRRA